MPELDESMKQWVNGIQRNTKIKWLAKSTFVHTLYESKEKLIADIKDCKIDFMNLSALDYFELGLTDFAIPLLTPSRGREGKFERYLLISNNKIVITDISKITKAEIVLPNSYFLSLIKVWLKVNLHDKMNKKNIKNITIVESNKNENETLHSVFFGNIDFAVVREGTFSIASELNPQLKNKIRIIDISPNLISYFLGYRKNIDPEIYSAISLEGMDLHKTVDGKQILNLALTECMDPLSLADLKETEDLIKRYHKIFK